MARAVDRRRLCCSEDTVDDLRRCCAECETKGKIDPYFTGVDRRRQIEMRRLRAMTAAGTHLEGLAKGLRWLFIDLASLSFALQSLAAIGDVSPHSMSLELGAAPSSIACVEQKSNPHSHIPGRDAEPPCCSSASAIATRRGWRSTSSAPPWPIAGVRRAAPRP